MLGALNYEVKVPAGEYAKYYFHLRSMIARLGYHRRRKSELLPLNVVGARKLQLATEEYANTKMIDADSKGKETSAICLLSVFSLFVSLSLSLCVCVTVCLCVCLFFSPSSLSLSLSVPLPVSDSAEIKHLQN
jgi:hypothetical protein